MRILSPFVSILAILVLIAKSIVSYGRVFPGQPVLGIDLLLMYLFAFSSVPMAQNDQDVVVQDRKNLILEELNRAQVAEVSLVIRCMEEPYFIYAGK